MVSSRLRGVRRPAGKGDGIKRSTRACLRCIFLNISNWYLAGTEFPVNVNGRFWIENEGHPLAGHGRIELLEHIRDCGSISEAARLMKMAYKAAWDSVAAINAAAGELVVVRSKGGRHGGGARLTAYGLALIRTYREMEEAHRVFLDQLAMRYPLRPSTYGTNPTVLPCSDL